MKPRLLLFRSLWTNGFDLDAALADCAAGWFDGVEGPVPSGADARSVFSARLRDAGMPFIAEIATGGGYVPASADPPRHLDDFRRAAEAAAGCRPRFLTVLAGCDRWPLMKSADLFARIIATAAEFGVEVSFETHRSRPTFNPWSTQALLDQLPELRLTADFSHWCCVCERLVLDDEPEGAAWLAGRVRHLHARVGYAQGPQVPHPAAPAFEAELAAHERWWDAVWSDRIAGGVLESTMTPEFGPDGYLQTRPFPGEPAADLDAVNRWMAGRQRDRFNAQFGANHRAATCGQS